MVNFKLGAPVGSKITHFLSKKAGLVGLDPKSQLPRRTSEYLNSTGNRISEVKKDLHRTTKRKYPYLEEMLTSFQSGELLKSLVMIHNGTKGIEVGTFTGYSALCMAEALPSNGELLTLEINPEFVELAKSFWIRAGVNKKIKPMLGDAMQTLNKLLLDPANIESFDFAYMDADKERYQEYYEAFLKLLRPKGLIMIDNVLWKGEVCVDKFISEPAEGIKKINRLIRNDQRVAHCNMIALDDGFSIVVKK